MLTCIFGGNGSGKSRFAESLVDTCGDPRYYVATMIPYGESGARRVQKHIRQRENLRFTTLELPYLEDLSRIPEQSVVLLEDLSNLLANRMFENKGDGEGVLEDVFSLSRKSRELFVVSITGYKQEDFSGDTARYVEALKTLNSALAEKADRVYEMKEGIPVLRKGEER